MDIIQRTKDKFPIHDCSEKDVEFILKEVKRNPLFKKRFQYYTEYQFEEAIKFVIKSISTQAPKLPKQRLSQKEKEILKHIKIK